MCTRPHPGVRLLRQALSAQNPRGQHRRVPCSVHTDCGDRDAGGHLGHRQQRVEPTPTELLEVNGTPITGRSVWAATTPAARAEAGAGDDHAQPAHARVLGVVGDELGSWCADITRTSLGCRARSAPSRRLPSSAGRSWQPSRCRRAERRPAAPRRRLRGRRRGPQLAGAGRSMSSGSSDVIEPPARLCRGAAGGRRTRSLRCRICGTRVRPHGRPKRRHAQHAAAGGDDAAVPSSAVPAWVTRDAAGTQLEAS